MDDAARAFVLSVVARWSKVPPGGVQLQHRLVGDLHMDGDDFGMSLVSEIEKHFGIKPRREEWESIETVRDLLHLVARHVDGAASGPGFASA